MIRILSDLHLGHRSSQIATVAHLEPLLDGVHTLVINGDGSEQLAPAFIPKADEMRQNLVDLCRRKGVELDEIPGNHDPKVKGASYREFLDGSVFVHHGDAIYPNVSPWSREVWRHRRFIKEFMHKHWREDFGLEGRMEFTRRLELAIPQIPHPRYQSALLRLLMLFAWPPHRPFMVLKTWWEAPRKSLDWARRYAPQAQLIICGHFHRSLCWTGRDGRHAWFSGPFTAPSFPSCIDLDLERRMAIHSSIESTVTGQWRVQRQIRRLSL